MASEETTDPKVESNLPSTALKRKEVLDQLINECSGFGGLYITNMVIDVHKENIDELDAFNKKLNKEKIGIDAEISKLELQSRSPSKVFFGMISRNTLEKRLEKQKLEKQRIESQILVNTIAITNSERIIKQKEELIIKCNHLLQLSETNNGSETFSGGYYKNKKKRKPKTKTKTKRKRKTKKTI